MIDDENFINTSPNLSPLPSRDTDVPLVQPLHGPERYRAGSITVTHTSMSPFLGSQQQLRQCSEESLHVKGKHETRIEKVTYAPYALYSCGKKVHYRSVGYSSGGDIVLLKDEISSSSDVERTLSQQRARSVSPVPAVGAYTSTSQTVVVNEAVSLENGKVYPGVRVVRGRKARNRTKNAYLLSKVTEAQFGVAVREVSPFPGDDDIELTRPSPFHCEVSGAVHKKWRKFVDVTEDVQDQLFSKRSNKMGSRGVAAPDPNLAISRFLRLSRDHITLLRKCLENSVLMQDLQGLESTVVSWLHDYCPGKTMNLDVILGEACHRKLLHVLAEFYLLKSWSRSVDGQRATTVSLGKHSNAPMTMPSMPSMSLCDFLNTVACPLKPQPIDMLQSARPHRRSKDRKIRKDTNRRSYNEELLA